MSRYYDMGVEIPGTIPAKRTEIKKRQRTNGLLTIGGLRAKEIMQASASDWLCGGETEEQFTERLSVAICAPTAVFAKSSVNATYLEEFPYETHTLDQDD